MSAAAPNFVADFDSATGMLRAASNVLHGRDFRAIGVSPVLEPLAVAANILPRRGREMVYAIGGVTETISPRRLDKVDAEKLSRWAVARYPARRYPAVMIGSSNGAMVHLCAAFGIPWLPQTFLIPVRDLGGDPDLPERALEVGRQHAPKLLEANPALQLHHMHDANQDRLMVRYMNYFRVKRRELGDAYARFLRESLEPGAPIIVIQCERKWPTTRVDDRHVFQHGAVGGATEEEFMHGGPRIEAYFRRYGVDRKKWDAPAPDGESPEAEWGFEHALGEDIERFARRHNHPVRRLVFEDPAALSPAVADFYRWWNRQRGIETDRLLVECFILVEPYWTLRTGSVPFWMVFNMEPDADCLERFLDEREPFDEINLMLFNQGTVGAGDAPIERWRKILSRARRRGQFIGVREDLFPRDFGTFAKYYWALRRKIRARHSVPPTLPVRLFLDFLAKRKSRYDVALH